MLNQNLSTGIHVAVPTVCEICNQHVGLSYDVHMVIAHPETRQKAEIEPDITKKVKKRGTK